MKAISRIHRGVAAFTLCTAGLFFADALSGLAAPAAAAPATVPADFADLVEKVGPAVVNIRTTERVRNGQGMPGDDDEMQEFFRRFFGIPIPRQQMPDRSQRRRQAPQQQDEEVPRGIGSGFIISADGYVLTNAHVVEGADEVYVTLTDTREFKAKIIGSDKTTDVALVKIEGANLPRVAIGDSNKIRPGEWVIAIGSPFNLENTVTAGIISAKARDTGDYLPLIQTDVAVNPGNSGGPLINMRGEVIGINSQIYSRSGGYMGISFAVPVDEAMRVVDQLKSTGKVTRGRLGVAITEVTKDVAESLGLAKSQGVLISSVETGGPADKAGLQPGDIVIKYNNVAVNKGSDLRRMIGSTKPGTKATITVWRKGANRDIAVTIAEMETEKPVRSKSEKRSKPEQPANALGLTVADLTDAQRKELRIDGGVIVDSVDGPAARAGLQPGDVILRVNNTDIHDAKQFNALVAKLEQKKTAVLLVRRGDASQFVPIKPGGQ
jgi:serine protease Do